MPYASANGIKLYYERAGEGTPLILHAHHHNKYMPFQLPYFSQFYDVIVPDRRGTGRSRFPSPDVTTVKFVIAPTQFFLVGPIMTVLYMVSSSNMKRTGL